MILVFYIDDILITHLHPQVVTEYIKKLERSYRQKDPLTVIRGKLYEYFRITLDFRTIGRYTFT